MPPQIVDTLKRRLGMSEKRAEELWDTSKKAAEESAKDSKVKYGFGLVVHILKKQLTPKQLKKLGWKRPYTKSKKK